MRSVEASRKLLQSLWDMDAEAVAEGIDRAHLEDYKGNLLLVGINYDKDKKHTCVIEKMER